MRDRLLMVDASRDASFYRKRRSPIREVRARNVYENSGRPSSQGELFGGWHKLMGSIKVISSYEQTSSYGTN
jgi:hypothetical protein